MFWILRRLLAALMTGFFLVLGVHMTLVGIGVLEKGSSILSLVENPLHLFAGVMWLGIGVLLLKRTR